MGEIDEQNIHNMKDEDLDLQKIKTDKPKESIFNKNMPVMVKQKWPSDMKALNLKQQMLSGGP